MVSKQKINPCELCVPPAGGLRPLRFKRISSRTHSDRNLSSNVNLQSMLSCYSESYIRFSRQFNHASSREFLLQRRNRHIPCINYFDIILRIPGKFNHHAPGLGIIHITKVIFTWNPYTGKRHPCK